MDAHILQLRYERNIVDDMCELELCLRTQKGVRCSFSRRPCPTKLMTSLSEQTSLSVV